MAPHICRLPKAEKDREIWTCPGCNVSWIWRETRDVWVWVSKRP